MITTPAILIACPVSDYKDYILKEWLEYVCSLEGEFDILLVDNSRDPDYHKTIPAKTNLTVEHIDPGKDSAQQFITRSRNIIRHRFLQRGYSHLMSIECDVFPPRDVIKRLLAHKKQIVSGWYFVGQKEGSYPLFVDITVFPENKHFTTYLSTFVQSFLKINGRLIETTGNGIGCTLIQRDVLEKLSFRIDPSQVGFDDSFFNQDLWINGIQHYCDTSVFCSHKNFNWQQVTEYVEKTATGETKELDFSEYNDMEKEKIKALISELNNMITVMMKAKGNFMTLINGLNMEKQKKSITGMQIAMIDKEIFELTRASWELEAEINAKMRVLEEYKKRL